MLLGWLTLSTCFGAWAHGRLLREKAPRRCGVYGAARDYFHIVWFLRHSGGGGNGICSLQGEALVLPHSRKPTLSPYKRKTLPDWNVEGQFGLCDLLWAYFDGFYWLIDDFFLMWVLHSLWAALSAGQACGIKISLTNITRNTMPLICQCTAGTLKKWSKKSSGLKYTDLKA